MCTLSHHKGMSCPQAWLGDLPVRFGSSARKVRGGLAIQTILNRLAEMRAQNRIQEDGIDIQSSRVVIQPGLK